MCAEVFRVLYLSPKLTVDRVECETSPKLLIRHHMLVTVGGSRGGHSRIRTQDSVRRINAMMLIVIRE